MINLFPPSTDGRLHPRSPNRGDKGTYVSTFEYYQGPQYSEDPQSCIVEKTSRFELNESNWDKVEFLNLLQAHPHAHLLVPNNIIAVMSKRLVEYYDYLFDPTLSDISVALDDAVRQGEVKIEEIMEMFTQIADGLAYIHDSGFVHQDVRRSNVLLVRSGGGFQAKLFDYGAVRKPYFLEEGLESWNVRPPEEITGNVRISAKQDVWMLGSLFNNVLPISNPNAPEAYRDIVSAATGGLDTRQPDAGIVRDQLQSISL